MAEHAQLIWVVTLTPGGDPDALLALARERATRLASVEGCFGAQVSRSRERPGTLTLIARWETKEAFERYRQTPEAVESARRVQELAQADPEVIHYESV